MGLGAFSFIIYSWILPKFALYTWVSNIAPTPLGFYKVLRGFSLFINYSYNLSFEASAVVAIINFNKIKILRYSWTQLFHSTFITAVSSNTQKFEPYGGVGKVARYRACVRADRTLWGLWAVHTWLIGPSLKPFIEVSDNASIFWFKMALLEKFRKSIEL